MDGADRMMKGSLHYPRAAKLDSVMIIRVYRVDIAIVKSLLRQFVVAGFAALHCVLYSATVAVPL